MVAPSGVHPDRTARLALPGTRSPISALTDNAPALALAVGPVVGVLAPKGMVVLLAAVALLTVADPARRAALTTRALQAVRRPRLGVLVLVAGLIWLAVTAAVTDAFGTGPRIATQLAGLLLIGIVASAAFGRPAATLRRRFLQASVLGLALGVVVQIEEGLTGGLLQGLGSAPPPDGWHLDKVNLGATNLVVFACAATGFLAGRRGLGFGLLAATTLLMLGFDSLAAVVAAAAATVVFGLASRWPDAIRFIVRWGGILVVVAMPVIVQDLGRLPPEVLDRLPASALHRVLIWNFALGRIAERPVLGWGLDSARHLGDGHTVVVRGRIQAAMPLHPHNGVLQIWVETGLPGLALLLIGVWAVTMRPRTGMAAAVEPAKMALVTAGGMIGLTAYGVWQMHWLSSLIVTGFAIMAVTRSSPECGLPEDRAEPRSMPPRRTAGAP